MASDVYLYKYNIYIGPHCLCNRQLVLRKVIVQSTNGCQLTASVGNFKQI